MKGSRESWWWSFPAAFISILKFKLMKSQNSQSGHHRWHFQSKNQGNINVIIFKINKKKSWFFLIFKLSCLKGGSKDGKWFKLNIIALQAATLFKLTSVKTCRCSKCAFGPIYLVNSNINSLFIYVWQTDFEKMTS